MAVFQEDLFLFAFKNICHFDFLKLHLPRKAEDEKGLESPVPRIVWITRTHDQSHGNMSLAKGVPEDPLYMIKRKMNRNVGP